MTHTEHTPVSEMLSRAAKNRRIRELERNNEALIEVVRVTHEWLEQGANHGPYASGLFTDDEETTYADMVSAALALAEGETP
jgi:hypothetical protein